MEEIYVQIVINKEDLVIQRSIGVNCIEPSTELSDIKYEIV